MPGPVLSQLLESFRLYGFTGIGTALSRTGAPGAEALSAFCGMGATLPFVSRRRRHGWRQRATRMPPFAKPRCMPTRARRWNASSDLGASDEPQGIGPMAESALHVRELRGRGVRRPERTSKELCGIVAARHKVAMQVVLASATSPKELMGIEDRLCSRFDWGMRVQIDMPEFEARAAILRKEAEMEYIDISEGVVSPLATHIKPDVCELEGAFIRVAAFASLKGEPISESLARDVLPPPG
jgi:Bacterial DnaA ATPAse domain